MEQPLFPILYSDPFSFLCRRIVHFKHLQNHPDEREKHAKSVWILRHFLGNFLPALENSTCTSEETAQMMKSATGGRIKVLVSCFRFGHLGAVWICHILMWTESSQSLKMHPKPCKPFCLTHVKSENISQDPNTSMSKIMPCKFDVEKELQWQRWAACVFKVEYLYGTAIFVSDASSGQGLIRSAFPTSRLHCLE